jgi:hypothetical protein
LFQHLVTPIGANANADLIFHDNGSTSCGFTVNSSIFPLALWDINKKRSDEENNPVNAVTEDSAIL